MTEIKIIDEIMGSGKTTAMINMINTSKYKKFIFVTPYLDEVQRILNNCKQKNFVEPKGSGTKLSNLKTLIQNGSNIVTTHALLKLFDKTVIELLKKRKYVLIVDETVETVSSLNVTGDDLGYILNATEVNENMLLHWKNKDYKGILNTYKKLADKNELVFSGDSLWKMLSVEIFKAFSCVYILTYMFDGQLLRSYLDFWKMPYEYEHVGKVPNYRYDELIHIYDKPKSNEIGDDVYALSATWYKTKLEGNVAKKISNNTRNFFRSLSNIKSEDVMWTVFKEAKSKIKTNGYSNGFIAINERATNEYRDRTACAYLVNRFVNPFVKSFYEKNGVEVDEDGMALSEMLQWIWRSAIRDGKPIDIYIPSRRMRELLKKWIVENSRKEITE